MTHPSASATGHDLRNLEVRSRSTNEHIGTVHEVVADDGGVPRYVCIAEPGTARHVLVPIGETEADRDKGVVWIADGAILRALPTCAHQAPEIETRSERRLERLDGASDFQVARDDPDPSGWTVAGRDGRTLGEVDHLIGDTGSMRVLYLAVRVDAAIDRNRRTVLIPVALVDLDTERQQVIARRFDAGGLQKLPTFRGGPVSRDEERTILTACTAISTERGTDDARPATW